MTALLDRLERTGHAVRLPHPSDRRSLLLHLTAEGERVIGWAFEQFRGALDAILTPEDQHQQVLDLLTRAGTALHTAAAPAGPTPTHQHSTT